MENCLENGLRRKRDNTHNHFIIMMSLGLQSNKYFPNYCFNCRIGRKYAKSNCQKLVALKICFCRITVIIMNRNSSDKNQSKFCEHPKFSLWRGVV